MRITNAHQNNLKNLSITLPEGQLIVVTGLSGSGKSSLAMDVIANEGYRYFLESLSSYNQQNSQVIPAAEVDAIEALPPVIRVDQSKRFQSVNATFGTLSDLASVFRIVFARYSSDEVLSKSLFSFNHPKGACECCNGIGEQEYIDLEKLVADKTKTLRDGAIATTLPNGYIVYSQVTLEELNKVCRVHDFSIDVPWEDLTNEQKNVILYGSDKVKVFYGKHSIESRLKWKGLKAKPREEGYYKGMLPIMNDILRRDRNPNILKFVSSRSCPECNGARLKAKNLKYRWQGLHFHQWMSLPLNELYSRLKGLDLKKGEQVLVHKICVLLFDLIRLGMADYQLKTLSTEISAGDAQRIKLIRQVNSNLQGILYVFDEPSVGLPKDYQGYLHHIFKRLISRGNTVMVVEHDLNLIRSADWIVELGPVAGIHGGKVIFNGPLKKFLNDQNLQSPTLTELRKDTHSTAKKNDPVPLDKFHPPSGKMTVFSRKTSQAMEAISAYAAQNGWKLLMVTDQPIGKTPRSNPATYTGLADKIRDLLAATPGAKSSSLAKSAFSFNNKTGRCQVCEGAGVITLSMNVMGTINQVCPQCNGKRFKPEVLKVEWKAKNIAEIYNLSVEEAFEFFAEEKKITGTLSLMRQLGLGYLKLGQPSNTLSGGEAQRIKLTKHFAKRSEGTLCILEEPSIGLHQQNVRELLEALHQLKKQTAGILCFENHMLFRDACDILIDNTPRIPKQDLIKIPPSVREVISIKGARTHYLKNINITLPKNRLSVVTGISGSGKSSLIIDTLQGYGLQEMSKQFSSYQQSRVGVNFQFEVDDISGLSPTICVTRKARNYTERSDVAKQVGIDRILRFAFSRKAQYEGSELSASHFSNTHELGKCPVCDGLGEELLPDPEKIVQDTGKSISAGLFEHNKALGYYGHAGSQYMAVVKELGRSYGFDLNTPYRDWSEVQKDILFYGTGEKEWTTNWEFRTKSRRGTQQVNMKWEGLFNYLKQEYLNTRKNKNIDSLTALLSSSKCRYCEGSGLNAERLKIQIGNRSIHEVKAMDFNGINDWLSCSHSDVIDQKLISAISTQLTRTIERARHLHIDHLQLNRKSTTLSGGENQRVSLIKQLNSPLKGITYLLDEPSAGLSGQNIPDLIDILNDLVEKGNTVIVIEHNKEIILASDHLVQLGPGAGFSGGAVTYQGKPRDYLKKEECHPYLIKPSQLVILQMSGDIIQIRNLSRHTLNKEKLMIPVGGITAISGRSGIGKTTLVKEVLIPGIKKKKPVHCESISFPKDYDDAHYFERRVLRAQSSTLMVMFLDLLKAIGKVFSMHSEYKAKDFSFKTKTSQCPDCKGSGVMEMALDVAASVIEKCETCQGRRYQPHILKVEVQAKNIAEVLAMNFEEIGQWVANEKVPVQATELLEQLKEAGLSHITLDQPVRSLSSGEQQRLLLLKWLAKEARNTLYVLDEPSVGLHYADIDRLFMMLTKLGKNNDILVIDHNPYLLEKIGVGVVLA